MDNQFDNANEKFHFVKGDGVEHYHFTGWAMILDENHILSSKHVSLERDDYVFWKDKKYVVVDRDNREENIIYTIKEIKLDIIGIY